MKNMMNKIAVPKEIMERIEFAVLAKGYSAHKTAQWIEFLFPNQYSFLEVMGIADSVKMKNENERNAS